jgi:hypothetical protein
VEEGGEVGAGKFVAVNSSVGNGVSVMGRAVKVGTVAVMVGDANGGMVPPMGWNGVGVAEAFGSGVISSTGERGGAKGAIPQAERRRSKRTWMVRRGFTSVSGSAYPSGRFGLWKAL